MKGNMTTMSTVVTAICAIVITGMVVRRELSTRDVVDEAPQQIASDWRSIASDGRVIGSPEASVEIVEFGDFQCVFCGRVRSVVDSIIAAYEGRVALRYHHFPLTTIHPHAYSAALAAECAAVQGRFAEFHGLLYSSQDQIGVRPWHEFAKNAGVEDLDGFHRCLDDEELRDRVDRDIEAAKSIGVNATPTFVVLNEMRSGALSSDEMSRWVRSAMKKTRRR